MKKDDFLTPIILPHYVNIHPSQFKPLSHRAGKKFRRMLNPPLKVRLKLKRQHIYRLAV